MRAPIHPRDLIALAAVAVLALAGSGTHIVASGDTLGDIAYSNGISVSALVEANGIANPDLIRIGQKLTIPGGSGSGGGGGGGGDGSTYTVVAGDTLGSIAVRHGTTVAKLTAANGLANPNLIRIGQKLTVAGGTAAAAAAPASSGGSSTPAQSARYHTVQPGETIAGIASKYGISSADLIAWNGLADGKLYASVRLSLFNPGSPPGVASGNSEGASHVVQSGETLATIASKYGTSASKIASASGLSNPNLIRIGQKLTIPAGGGGGGGFRCPVPGAVFFNDWGFPRSGGRAHAGNDLFAPRGTPVLAPASGVVDIVEGSIGGKQFRLRANDGTTYIGSHMDGFANTGSVNAGDVIGYVGDTGNAKGSSPHLHFEVHVNGNPVNPFPVARAAC